MYALDLKYTQYPKQGQAQHAKFSKLRKKPILLQKATNILIPLHENRENQDSD